MIFLAQVKTVGKTLSWGNNVWLPLRRNALSEKTMSVLALLMARVFVELMISCFKLFHMHDVGFAWLCPKYTKIYRNGSISCARLQRVRGRSLVLKSDCSDTLNVRTNTLTYRGLMEDSKKMVWSSTMAFLKVKPYLQGCTLTILSFTNAALKSSVVGVLIHDSEAGKRCVGFSDLSS